MANPWERDWSQQGGGVYVPPSQSKQRGTSAEAGSKESQERTDVATEADRIRKARADADRAESEARNAALQGQLNAMELELKNITGGLSVGDFNDRRAKLAQYSAVVDQINRVQQLLNEGPNKTSGLSGLRDYLPSEQGAAIDAASAALAQQAFSAFRVPGAGPQSDADQRLFVEANQPSRKSFDSANSERLMALRSKIEKDLANLGQGVPEWVPETRGNVLPQANLARQAPQSETSLSAQGRNNIIMDPAMAGFGAQAREAFAKGATADQLIAMEAQKMAELGRPLLPERIQFYRDIEQMRAKSPNTPAAGFPIDWGRLETTTENDGPLNVLGAIAESPIGAGVTNAVNAAAFGLPAAMSGQQGEAILNAMREESPVSSFVGDAGGSLATLAGLGLAAPVRGLGWLGKAGGAPADIAYSTLRGGIEGGPVGAGVGFASGLVGDVAGRGVGQVARRAGVTGGPERPDTYLRLIGKEVDDVEPIMAAMNSGRALNVPLNVADVAPRLRPMAGAGYRRADWETQDVINQALQGRQLSRGERYRDAIERELGPLGNPLASQEQLIGQGRAASKPFYDAFRAEGPASSPVIDQILMTEIGQQALGRASRIGEMEGLPPIEFEAGLALSPSTLDLVKRGFDDQLYNSKIPTSGVGKAELGALQGMRGRYVSELDSLYPATYPQARAAFAGPASIAEAMEKGGGALKLHPRNVAAEMSDLNPDQVIAYQVGLRNAMADKGAQVVDTADPWRSGLGAPEARERVSEVFGSEPANRLSNQLDWERAMAATNQSTIGNSATAGRLMADEKLSGDMMGEMGANAAIDMATGGAPVATGLGLINRFAKDRAGLGFSGAREGVSSELARFLLNTDMEVDEINRLLAQAVDYEKYAQEVRRKAAMGGSALTASGASTFGVY